MFVCCLSVASPAFTQDSLGATTSAANLLTDSIESLQEVETELNSLNAQIKTLQELLTASQGDSMELRKLLKEYQDRVAQLRKRFGELLKISAGLKQSSRAHELAWQIGIPSALAVGIIAGLLIGGHR